MRIIFLNCWNALAGKPFFDFLQASLSDTEIYCFQEVSPELHEKIASLLPNYLGHYLTEGRIINLGFVTGQAIFMTKNIKMLSTEKINLYRQVYNDVGYLQYALVKINGRIVSLANVHGKARPGHKLDTPARIRQTEKMLNFLKNKPSLKIIGGDFNLLPQTKSITLFEKAGYINLTDKFGIKDTRGNLNHRRFTPKEVQYFADYVFVSPGVKVLNFEVPNVEISDHLPLILDFTF